MKKEDRGTYFCVADNGDDNYDDDYQYGDDDDDNVDNDGKCHHDGDDACMMRTIAGVGSPAKRHVALDVEFAPSFVDSKVSGHHLSKHCHIMSLMTETEVL